jgi:hypothetical protein
VVLAAALAIAAPAVGAQAGSPAIGDLAPAPVVHDLDGKPVDLTPGSAGRRCSEFCHVVP